MRDCRRRLSRTGTSRPGLPPIAAEFDGEKHAVGSPEEAGAMLEELAQPGDRVLVKGSRSAGLERVLAG